MTIHFRMVVLVDHMHSMYKVDQLKRNLTCTISNWEKKRRESGIRVSIPSLPEVCMEMMSTLRYERLGLSDPN